MEVILVNSKWIKSAFRKPQMRLGYFGFPAKTYDHKLVLDTRSL